MFFAHLSPEQFEFAQRLRPYLKPQAQRDLAIVEHDREWQRGRRDWFTYTVICRRGDLHAADAFMRYMRYECEAAVARDGRDAPYRLGQQAGMDAQLKYDLYRLRRATRA